MRLGGLLDALPDERPLDTLEADSPRLVALVESFRENHPTLAERGEAVSADKAYDDGADKARLYERHGLAPLIPPRDTITLAATGQVCCRIAPFEPDPATGIGR